MAFDAFAMIVVLPGDAARIKAALVVSASVHTATFTGVVRTADVVLRVTVFIGCAFVLATTTIYRVVGISFKPFKAGALGTVVECMADSVRPALTAITCRNALVATDTNLTLGTIVVQLAALNNWC